MLGGRPNRRAFIAGLSGAKCGDETDATTLSPATAHPFRCSPFYRFCHRGRNCWPLDNWVVTPMARWRVDIIRKRAERLGIIEAASEKEAIEKAAKEFDMQGERGG